MAGISGEGSGTRQRIWIDIMDKNENFLSKTVKYSQYPQAKNTNILYFIKQSVLKDEELAKYIDYFYTADNDIKRMDYIEQILLRSTSADSIEVSLESKSINQQKLYVLEYLDKLSLISFSINYNGRSYSETELADIVDREFENLKFELYAKLMQELYLNRHFQSDYNERLIKKVDDMMKEELNNSSFHFNKQL